jgi:hypothetical protein
MHLSVEALIELIFDWLPYLAIIIIVFGVWRERPASVRGLFTVAFCGIYLAMVGRRTDSHWLLLVAAISFAGAMALEIWNRKQLSDKAPEQEVDG